MVSGAVLQAVCRNSSWLCWHYSSFHTFLTKSINWPLRVEFPLFGNYFKCYISTARQAHLQRGVNKQKDPVMHTLGTAWGSCSEFGSRPLRVPILLEAPRSPPRHAAQTLEHRAREWLSKADCWVHFSCLWLPPKAGSSSRLLWWLFSKLCLEFILATKRLSVTPWLPPPTRASFCC